MSSDGYKGCLKPEGIEDLEADVYPLIKRYYI